MTTDERQWNLVCNRIRNETIRQRQCHWDCFITCTYIAQTVTSNPTSTLFLRSQACQIPCDRFMRRRLPMKKRDSWKTRLSWFMMRRSTDGSLTASTLTRIYLSSTLSIQAESCHCAKPPPLSIWDDHQHHQLLFANASSWWARMERVYEELQEVMHNKDI